MSNPTPAELANFNLAQMNMDIAARELFATVNERGMGGAAAPSADLVAATAKLQAATAALA